VLQVECLSLLCSLEKVSGVISYNHVYARLTIRSRDGSYGIGKQDQIESRDLTLLYNM